MTDVKVLASGAEI